MGSYCSILNDSRRCTMYVTYWPNVDAILNIFALSTQLGGAAFKKVTSDTVVADGLNQSAINVFRQYLSNGLRGSFGERGPGSSYVSEKLSLSLCVSARLFVLDVRPPSSPGSADGRMILKTGYKTMWSGATADSTNHYNLSEFYRE